MTVDNLAEHIHPRPSQSREGAPITARITVDRRIVQILEIFCPYQLGAIPHGTTVDTALLHHRADTSSTRVQLAVFFP